MIRSGLWFPIWWIRIRSKMDQSRNPGITMYRVRWQLGHRRVLRFDASREIWLLCHRQSFRQEAVCPTSFSGDKTVQWQNGPVTKRSSEITVHLQTKLWSSESERSDKLLSGAQKVKVLRAIEFRHWTVLSPDRLVTGPSHRTKLSTTKMGSSLSISRSWCRYLQALAGWLPPAFSQYLPTYVHMLTQLAYQTWDWIHRLHQNARFVK